MESIKKVQIGSQIWMAENLNVSELSNGDVIKEAQSDLDWAECITSAKSELVITLI